MVFCLNGSAAIMALVILNFIGRGLLPKGAAFCQAIVPKLAWKSSSANRALQQGRAFAAKNLSIGHLCKSPISFPFSPFFSLTSSWKNLISHLSPQKQAMSLTWAYFFVGSSDVVVFPNNDQNHSNSELCEPSINDKPIRGRLWFWALLNFYIVESCTRQGNGFLCWGFHTTTRTYY